MRNRRVLLAVMSFTAGVVALSPMGVTGATSSPISDAPSVGVALVGLEASGIEPVAVMIAVHTDAESGHTAYAFVDEYGEPIAPPAAGAEGR